MALDLARVGGAAARVGAAAGTAAAAGSPAASFADTLGQMVDTTEQSQADANGAVVNMLDGSVDVHDAMIALQRAELNMQLTIQVRNKLVNAYHEIMRMPI